MKLDQPKNINYAATIVRLKNVHSLEGLDNLVAAPVLGHQALILNTHSDGELGVAFTAETQLSEQYAHHNNLFRDATLNADTEEQPGYLENNRRIRAIKLRGHRSDALFMPLSSLEWAGVKAGDFSEGDTFDTINGHEICRKYVVPVKGNANAKVKQPKVNKFELVDAIHAPEHIDTPSFFRAAEQKICEDDHIIVTAKYHGTSVRIFNTITNRKLTWLEKLAKKIGVKVQETEYAPVYGSRRVIKNDVNAGTGYFEHDIWSEHGKRLDGLIPAGYAVYGEIVGWTKDGKPIQPNYTYGYPEGESELFVYRVAHVNPQGILTDLSWDQVEEFCADRGIKTVPVVWRGIASQFNVNDWMDKRYRDSGLLSCLPLSGAKTVDEGVVIRKEGLTPELLKAKSPIFLQHETKQLDKGEVDLESVDAA